MKTFSALLAICAGNSPVTCEVLSQRPSTRSLDVFFDLHMNKRLCKQSWGWWFETPSRSLWRDCNDNFRTYCTLDTRSEIGLRWMPQSPTDTKSTFVQVMVPRGERQWRQSCKHKTPPDITISPILHTKIVKTRMSMKNISKSILIHVVLYIDDKQKKLICWDVGIGRLGLGYWKPHQQIYSGPSPTHRLLTWRWTRRLQMQDKMCHIYRWVNPRKT